MKTAKQGPLPLLEQSSRFFWTAGESGELKIQRCRSCGYWQHPPGVVCVDCGDDDLTENSVSGLATVVAVSVNYQPWMPEQEVPYALAIVELDEQQNLRLTTRIVGIQPDAVTIGQRVKVQFEHVEDVWLPLFTPI